MLKALDIARLSWLTDLFNVTWTSRAVPAEWQTGLVVHVFKKGGSEGVLQLLGDQTTQSLDKCLLQGVGKEA